MPLLCTVGTCIETGRKGLLLGRERLVELQQDLSARLGLQLPAFDDLPPAVRGLSFDGIATAVIKSPQDYWGLHNALKKDNKLLDQQAELAIARQELDVVQKSVRHATTHAFWQLITRSLSPEPMRLLLRACPSAPVQSMWSAPSLLTMAPPYR